MRPADIEAVIVRNTVLWNVAPCGLVKVYHVLEDSTVSIFSVKESANRKEFLLSACLFSIFLYFLLICVTSSVSGCYSVGWYVDWWVMNCTGFGRKRSWLYLREYSSICLAGLRNTMKNFSQDRHCPVWDSNRKPPEFKCMLLSSLSPIFLWRHKFFYTKLCGSILSPTYSSILCFVFPPFRWIWHSCDFITEATGRNYWLRCCSATCGVCSHPAFPGRFLHGFRCSQ
jgi:hypothetical protein